MQNKEESMWIINIETAAADVAANIGIDTVNSVFRRYGAHSLEDLSPCYYCNVFDELDFIANGN